ncbi:zf-TFIIB domain-containing protein [Pseudidiomarina aestuarii]|uniref:TFIIB-type zinc ribbon-containing protein n=1 Tax=Pseudidiomarina aestuarii TaxID=624146 RepID=UPI003A96A209
MKCPVCITEKLMRIGREGTEIDYCSGCRGGWLVSHELEKLIESASSLHSHSNDQISSERAKRIAEAEKRKEEMNARREEMTVLREEMQTRAAKRLQNSARDRAHRHLLSKNRRVKMMGLDELAKDGVEQLEPTDIKILRYFKDNPNSRLEAAEPILKIPAADLKNILSVTLWDYIHCNEHDEWSVHELGLWVLEQWDRST